MGEVYPSSTTSNTGSCDNFSSEICRQLASDVNDFWSCGGNIDVIDAPVMDHDVLLFVREYVSTRRPCILRNAFLNHNCQFGSGVRSKLTLDDLISRSNEIQEQQSSSFTSVQDGENASPLMTVDVTPDGHGDCVRQIICKRKNDDGSLSSSISEENEVKMFVKPMEVSMTLQHFADKMRNGRERSKKSEIDSCIDEDDVRETNSFSLLQFSDLAQDEIAQLPTPTLKSSVYYYSRQNDCLRTELATLNINYPPTFDWAEMAFGTGPPDAINLWIGDERAVSSMHKDPYENLFYVWSGEKVFTLLPPSDVLFLPEKEYDCGSFVNRSISSHSSENINNDDSGEMTITSDNGKYHDWYVQPEYQETSNNENSDDISRDQICKNSLNYQNLIQEKIPEKVRWIEPDIEHLISPSRGNETVSDTFLSKKLNLEKKYPSLKYVKPIRVTVKEGDMLYLPSLWFHRVTQTCETVGINYWYDMKFEGPHWSMFQFLQQIKNK